MAITTTQLNSRRLILDECVNQDETLSAAGALTYAEGTVLGRITASGKLTHYASGAADGSQTPVAVLEAAYTFTGAGDKRVRPIVSGQVRAESVVLHGVGALTVAVSDLLRSYGIVPVTSAELADQES